MRRRDLRHLSRLRLAEARKLLEAAHYEGAYYLAGYAVECALKACISRQFGRHVFPDRKVVNDSYTHDLGKLIGVAGLTAEFDAAVAASRSFESNWVIVKDWSEEDRYNASVSEARARNLYRAIASRRTGIMSWLRKNW